LLAKYHQAPPAPAAPAVKTTEKAPKKATEKATEKKGKKVEPEKEEPLDPLAEKLRQQRLIVCIYFVFSV
jgi:translation initiation factor 3 subunit J